MMANQFTTVETIGDIRKDDILFDSSCDERGALRAAEKCGYYRKLLRKRDCVNPIACMARCPRFGDSGHFQNNSRCDYDCGYPP